MYQTIFESRLLRSAQSESGQMQEDYSAQYDEFRALAQGVLFRENRPAAASKATFVKTIVLGYLHLPCPVRCRAD